MNVELYGGSGDFYQYTQEQIDSYRNGIFGPFPVVVRDGEIIAIQPWDPENNNEPWPTDQDALAWGSAYIAAALQASTDAQNREASRASAVDKLIRLGLTREEISALTGSIY